MMLLANSCFIGLFAYWVIGLFSHSASAQSMSNDNFILQVQDLDTTSESSLDENKIDKKVQKDAGQEQKPNIKSGKAAFAFSISESLIYFGHLSPTNPILRSNKLSISNDLLNGYSVLGFEDKELSWPTGAEALEFPELASQSATVIPDVTCDNGLCSEIRSAPWTNTLTYGFGLRCDNITGLGCLDDFYDETNYKQFANISKNEIPQAIISGELDNKKSVYQITYKLNIAGTQLNRPYSNTITFIAVPNF